MTDALTEIEISFIGRVPRSAISLRLEVDDSSYVFNPEARARIVKWNCGMYVRTWYCTIQL